MPDLGDQIRRYVDGIAEPISIGEVRHVGAAAGPDRARRRWPAVAAAAAIVVVTGVFVGLREGDSDDRLDAGAGPDAVIVEGSEPPFELLDMQPGSEAMGTLRAAVDPEELRALWSSIGFDGEPHDVDFDRWVVVSITIPDDACPPALVGFDRSGATWTPRFVEPAGGCNDPLIPKTYVVGINRAEAAPSFTLRLPADSTYGFDEQLLTVEVPSIGATAPTTTGASSTGDTIGRVALPPVGEARSAIVGNGLPIWVVHHADGSVTAVPGVVPGGDDADGLGGLWSLVRWSPAGSFTGPITWDAWGRAITGGRDADLAGFTARIEGTQVVVEASDRGRVPGEPVVPASFGSAPVDPALPPLVDLDADLPEGWSLLDAGLVGSSGVVRLCVVEGDVPVPEMETCPPAAPEVEGLVVPAGSIAWMFGPLLVDVDPEGRIVAVVALGGSAARADG